MQGPEDGSLRQAFLVWLQHVLLPSKGEEDIPELVDLEDFRVMLYETVRKWEVEMKKEGRKEERRDFLLRMLEVKFGPVDAPTRDRIRKANSQHLLKWGECLVTAERLADVFAA